MSDCPNCDGLDGTHTKRSCVSPSSGTPPTEGTLERELRDALEEIRVIATEMGPYSAIRERAWVAIVLLERLRGVLEVRPMVADAQSYIARAQARGDILARIQKAVDDYV